MDSHNERPSDINGSNREENNDEEGEIYNSNKEQNYSKIKGFVIAGSASGYVLGASIYSGKEGPAASKDLVTRVVLKLTEPYLNKGVNNWYTSVPLFLELEILLPKNINCMVYFDNFFSPRFPSCLISKKIDCGQLLQYEKAALRVQTSIYR